MTLWQLLVDQQFWLFGRDVTAENGNRLLDLGGERAAHWRRGKAACYVMPAADDSDSRVVLWGFGALLVRSGVPVIYLQRTTGKWRVALSNRVPLDVSNATAATFLNWPALSSDEPVREHDGAEELTRWIATHERSVRERYGMTARTADVAAWAGHGKRTVAVERLVTVWTYFGRGDQTLDSATSAREADSSLVAV